MQVDASGSSPSVNRDGIPICLVVKIYRILRYAPTWHSKSFVASFPPLLILNAVPCSQGSSTILTGMDGSNNQTYRWCSCKSCSFTSRITSSAFVELSDRPDCTEDSVDGRCCLWVEGVCTRTCASLRSLKPSPSAKMPVCWNWRHWTECDLRQCLVSFYVTEWIGWKWNCSISQTTCTNNKKTKKTWLNLLVFEFHHVKLSGNSYWFMDDERTKTGSL